MVRNRSATVVVEEDLTRVKLARSLSALYVKAGG
jgi:hypothetical protein